MTIADNIEDRLIRDLRVKPKSVEGRRRAEWILMDYIDFVVHVFVAEKREFYRLELLWGDAPRVETEALALPAAQESTERKTSSA